MESLRRREPFILERFIIFLSKSGRFIHFSVYETSEKN